jgi:chaperonin GroES
MASDVYPAPEPNQALAGARPFAPSPDEPAPESEYDDAPADEPKTDVAKVIANIRSPNLAADMDGSLLSTIGTKVVEEFDIDLASRKAEGWDERHDAAMKLALQVKEEKSYPWPKAANVKYPLIITAAIQFAARAYPAIVDGPNLVKGKVLGQPNDAKIARAKRIGDHMSYQLTEDMPGWEEDTDRLLHMLPIVGCVVRKTYYDPLRGCNRSEMIPPDKFVVDYWTKDLETCPRATHVQEFYPHQIEEKFRSDLWRKVEIGQAPDANGDDAAPHQFLEQHRLWDLDDDGYPEPYIVTVHKETRQVVRIVARYDESGVKGRDSIETIVPVRYFTKYPFIPSPDGSWYDIGFGMLLNALNQTINSTINQLLDAGHLQNLQAGFIGSGVSIKSGSLKFQPGEWKRVETTGADLKSSVVPLPTQQPSAVLFQLLGMLIDSAKEITATKDILTGDQPANTPVGTTLALIEQGLKVFTAIYKRIHRAFKLELECLYRLNSLYLDPQAYFTFQDVPGVIAQQDYKEGDCDVIPVSDPNVVTDMQRLGRAQYLGQFLGKGLDDHAIMERMFQAANIPDIGELAQKQAPQPPLKDQNDARKLDLEERKLALEEERAHIDAAQAGHEDRRADREADLAAAETVANIGLVEAEAHKTEIEAAQLGAALLPQIQDAIHRAIADALATAQAVGRASDATAVAGQADQTAASPAPQGMTDATAQPGELRPLAQPAGNEAVPAVPQGPAGDAGQGMDAGNGNVPATADQSPPDGGAGGPPVQ